MINDPLAETGYRRKKLAEEAFEVLKKDVNAVFFGIGLLELIRNLLPVLLQVRLPVAVPGVFGDAEPFPGTPSLVQRPDPFPGHVNQEGITITH